VDLLEDTYEYCRLWCYDKLGIEHESDNSFKAWDYVRTEFLSTIKRLMNLDYENIILISHEDTSKDITKKTGDKITAIKPNIQDKTANKVAGMVDVVARVVADGDVRTLNFKSNEVIFGGGRLKLKNTEIPLTYEDLLNEYETINCCTRAGGASAESTPIVTQGTDETGPDPEKHKTRRSKKEPEQSANRVEQEEVKTEPAQTEQEETSNDKPPFDGGEPSVEEPKTRTRRTRKNREQ
jgi:hypothetical protein